jgi:small-conductance mechanosensitive channel
MTEVLDSITAFLELPPILQNELVLFVVIVVGFAIFAKIFLFIIKKYVKSFAAKTSTDLDDLIVQIITMPLYALIISFGVFVGLKILTPLAEYSDLIDSAFFVVAVLLVSLMVSRILALVVGSALRVQKKYEKTPKLINRLVKVTVYLIALVIILGFFGVEITPIIAALGLGGLAIGLALQPTLSSFIAGMHIISDKPVQVGDFIELEGKSVSGFVEDIGWRSTRIKALGNKIIVIPNSTLADSIIVNNSLPEPEMSCVIQCGVAYGSDLEKVEKITIDVAKQIQQSVQGAVKTHDPFIRFHTFGDSNINFSIILRIETFVNKYALTHEFIKALKKRFDKENIEIAWPVRKIYKGKE